MQRLLCCQICLMRLFGRVKQTQPDHFVIKLDLGKPFAILLANAHVAAFSFRLMSVLGVLSVRSFSKVAQAVVRSIAVNVVNLFRRPRSMYVQPGQSMRQVQDVVQPNSSVACLQSCASQSAGTTFATRHAPRKQARVRVVVDQLFQAVVRKFWNVHNKHNITFAMGCQT